MWWLQQSLRMYNQTQQIFSFLAFTSTIDIRQICSKKMKILIKASRLFNKSLNLFFREIDTLMSSNFRYLQGVRVRGHFFPKYRTFFAKIQDKIGQIWVFTGMCSHVELKIDITWIQYLIASSKMVEVVKKSSTAIIETATILHLLVHTSLLGLKRFALFVLET